MRTTLLTQFAVAAFVLLLASPSQPRANEVSEPGQSKIAVPENRFPKVGDDGPVRVSFDDLDLKSLKLDPTPLDVMDHLPDWMEKLDGKRIRIRGYMLPTFEAEGNRVFVLAEDNNIANFGRAVKVYELINVRMSKGTTTKYLPRDPFDVEGTFHLVPPAPDDEVLIQLYEIRDAKIIPVPAKR